MEKAPQVEHQTGRIDLLEMIKLLTKFQSVERQIYIEELQRFENDSEHSYNLALTAWAIIDQDKLPLDTGLVIQYALVHDLVEIYAGDTPAFDKEARLTKAAREHAALKELRKNNLTKNFAKIANKYENLQDEESRFVYGLDKLLALITLIHNNQPIVEKDILNTTWQEVINNKDTWLNLMQDKIIKSEYLRPYLNQCIKTYLDQYSNLLDAYSEVDTRST